MKSLDLRKLPTKLINLDSHTDRLTKVSNRLSELGITFDRFSAISHERGIVGCGQSHLEVISNIKPETLVLEDDVVPTEWFRPVVEIPDEADALYLGNSIWGYHERSWPKSSIRNIQVTPHSENLVRVHNMCSTHAIIYMKQTYIDAVVEMTERCLANDTPFDLGLAKLHSSFTIFASSMPMFYQEDLPNDTLVSFKPRVY